MKYKNLFKLIVPALLFLGWQMVTELSLINPFIIPSPLKVLKQLINLLINEKLFLDISYTLLRTSLGFLLACLIGIPLGLMMGYYNKVYNLFEFVIEFFRNIPVTAILPLFLLILGIGEASKIAFAFWPANLVLIINSIYGVKFTNKTRLKAMQTLKLKNWQLFEKVIFPQALPQIMAGARTAVSLSFIVVIVGEMLTGTSFGLGKKIIDFQLIYKTASMYAVILVTGLLGLAINKMFMIFEKKLIYWQ
jgi:ABC-type nitrate/sulfonate/bicarbonate transport system permease component